ncbi:unnamed protein product [Pleuronectes platessa]|uniref:Uncharacterized protein n=1 Tax=Pleuronectes platessa TaxID=8262 RepID=A0A9N7Y7Z5_PLEPL|nr:unnamed protein product [Pleuronectes platessa]
MDQIEERLAEEVRKYDHLYKDTQMACNSWKDTSANVGLQVAEEHRHVPHNAATLPRPPTLSDAVESHCQQSARGQGAWRQDLLLWRKRSDLRSHIKPRLTLGSHRTRKQRQSVA